jgi:hypothetical protein
VRTVLEGSVRRANNRLRITVQLVDAADGYHLWSDRYDREMKEIFDIQDEIARSVPERLKVTLALIRQDSTFGLAVICAVMSHLTRGANELRAVSHLYVANSFCSEDPRRAAAVRGSH